MGLRNLMAKTWGARVAAQTQAWSGRPHQTQAQVFKELLEGVTNTAFGKDHGLHPGLSYEQFRQRVPIRDYEGLRPYVDRVVKGERDVLWKGRPIYFAKTSGTTSGAKYIPISAESISNHIDSARNALLLYIYRTGKAAFSEGKMIFLSGSPALDYTEGVPTGRLSGIVNHHIPRYLRTNQLPDFKTNCIEDWEEKLDRIVELTLLQDMRLISGIPPWVQMYFDRLEAVSGKKIGALFPNFSLLVYGGVNFEPYRAKLEESIGRAVDLLETYPASEGFLAFQDREPGEGLLLILNKGIFYEFIRAEEFFTENPERIPLEGVETGQNYVMIMHTNAGLWGYNIGDTVRFVSTEPYRLLVTGRISHFISAFGEHVIGEEVEFALMQAAKEFGYRVVEFTVAPMVNPPKGLPYHEWFVEWDGNIQPKPEFMQMVDELLQRRNMYYRDLISGKILRPLVMHSLKKGAFISYMKSEGKLGGQNKVPRLSNDRKIAEVLSSYIIK